MVSDEIRTVLRLDKELQQRVVGQDHALREIAERIRTSRANLTDPDRPIGVFFLVGPSGVGKTETALTLAELLYGGEQNMTTINMSEFKEEHKVSLLMGSPRDTSAMAKAASSPKPFAENPTASSSSTKWKKLTPVFRTSSTRSSTKAI
ncbi:MAG UNVERIFIED_CONTAM: AAA family ATPase [Planctomycetaceae bacterium]